jgi:hypothetical protein
VAKQTVTQCRTLVKFDVQESIYTTGVGASTVWNRLTVSLSEDTTTDCFYCEWQNAFGGNAIEQQALGNLQPARIRLPYVKKLYDALVTSKVKIYKNGIADDLHTFELNSSPDNYLEGNKFIEFQVKRVEVK